MTRNTASIILPAASVFSSWPQLTFGKLFDVCCSKTATITFSIVASVSFDRPCLTLNRHEPENNTITLSQVSRGCSTCESTSPELAQHYS